MTDRTFVLLAALMGITFMVAVYAFRNIIAVLLWAVLS